MKGKEVGWKKIVRERKEDERNGRETRAIRLKKSERLSTN